MSESKNKESEVDPSDKYLDLGVGITISPDEPLHPSQEEVPDADDHEEKRDRDLDREYDYLLNDDKKKQFVDEPCYPDQYARYPETVRRVGPTIQVFDMSKTEDAHELNKIMSGSQNHSAPRSMLAIMDKQWSEKEGSWKILAQVYKFKYLKILERD